MFNVPFGLSGGSTGQAMPMAGMQAGAGQSPLSSSPLAAILATIAQGGGGGSGGAHGAFPQMQAPGNTGAGMLQAMGGVDGINKFTNTPGFQQLLQKLGLGQAGLPADAWNNNNNPSTQGMPVGMPDPLTGMMSGGGV